VAEAVLDASAALALLLGEPGGEEVVALLSGGLISSVNACEVQTRLIDRGLPPESAAEALTDLRLTIASFTVEDAFIASVLRGRTRRAGLSLGDRACLALGLRTGLPVYTADGPWAEIGLPLDIRLIR
jgi:PIN domain nuclease of toxin-antitoxin system